MRRNLVDKSKQERKIIFSVTAGDLIFQSFTVGGAGGQGRDHVNTGVRYILEIHGIRDKISVKP
jgi:protein subunit release factor B